MKKTKILSFVLALVMIVTMILMTVPVSAAVDTSNGLWYYMNASGYMVTGRQLIGGKYYTFNSSGVWVG